MKQVEFTEFGRPEDVVSVVCGQSPDIEDGQIAVKMLAAPINPADINFIEGTYGVKPSLPAVPGIEGVGCVEDSRAEGFQIGDKVIFLERVGTWRELIICDASSAMVVDNHVNVEQAAMLKVNPMTALCLLQNYVDLKPGDWVIQNAANSGVGQSVIQIAKILGLRTINLVRRAELIPQLYELGADKVFLDDSESKAELSEFCTIARPTLVCNAIGGDSSIRLMNTLVEKGVHVTYGAMSRRPVTIPNKYLIFRQIRFEGLWITKWLEDTPRNEVESSYRKLANWIESGKLEQSVDSAYQLEHVVQALERAQQPNRSGKVLICM